MKTLKTLTIAILVVLSTNFTTTAQLDPVYDTTITTLFPFTCYQSVHVDNDTLSFTQDYLEGGSAVSNPFTFTRNNLDSVVLEFFTIGEIYLNSQSTLNYQIQENVSPFTMISTDTITVTQVPTYHRIVISVNNLANIPLVLNFESLSNYKFVKIYNIVLKAYWFQSTGINEFNNSNKEHKLVKVYNLSGQEVPYSLNLTGIYILVYSDNTTEKRLFIK